MTPSAYIRSKKASRSSRVSSPFLSIRSARPSMIWLISARRPSGMEKMPCISCRRFRFAMIGRLSATGFVSFFLRGFFSFCSGSAGLLSDACSISPPVSACGSSTEKRIPFRLLAISMRCSSFPASYSMTFKPAAFIFSSRSGGQSSGAMQTGSSNVTTRCGFASKYPVGISAAWRYIPAISVASPPSMSYPCLLKACWMRMASCPAFSMSRPAISSMS